MELNVLHLSMYICTFVLQFVYLSFFWSYPEQISCFNPISKVYLSFGSLIMIRCGTNDRIGAEMIPSELQQL